MRLGCIADDLTGATDLGVTLAREGLSVVQVNGVPEAGLAAPDADAVVVALKSRTNPPAQAVEWSLQALAWLRRALAGHIYFKVCSTFDSTPRGNIGPVADACSRSSGRSSRSLPRRTPAISARCTSAICSSAACRSPNRACATTRSRR